MHSKFRIMSCFPFIVYLVNPLNNSCMSDLLDDKENIVEEEYVPPRQRERLMTFIRLWGKKFLIVSGVISIPIVIVALIYWFHFYNNGISYNNADWSAFATFLYAGIAYINLLIFSALTYLLFIYNGRSEGRREYQNILHEKPIIIFSYTTSDKCYSIQNIGKGAAINVQIKTNLLNRIWEYGYIWNSLPAKNDPEKMLWTMQTNVICATYSDSFKNEYVSYMENDQMRLINCAEKAETDRYKTEFKNSRLKSKEMTWRP